MPYKDPKKQKRAQARYFQENKERLRVLQNSKRSQVRKRIQEVKTGKSCKDCEEEYPYYMLDFDHLPGSSKKFNIGTTSNTTSMAALEEEIAKCEIVCANCHRHRTFMRG